MRLFIFLLLLAATPMYAQTIFRVMTYNVENLFDVKDNPDKEDNDFLPTGNRYWNTHRYYFKQQQLAKVITAAGEWNAPALVGLCEVENDSVLFDLTQRTSLRAQEYRYVITSHSDKRGINVALLYQRDQFRYLHHQSIPIRFSKQQHKSTREILHVSGEMITRDTLDVFLCHFPSRYGGEKESEQDRFDAATTLRKTCDSIIQARTNPQILIMGDFNDTPKNKSLSQVVGASPSNEKVQVEASYINLIPKSLTKGVEGTHKHQGEWNQLDHIIVNRKLMEPNSRMQPLPESIQIFSPSFLLTKDKTWRGIRPFRTYYGYKYERGFSDHLPIIADFYLHLSTNKTKIHEH